MAINGLSQLVHITNTSDIGGGASVGLVGAAVKASATQIGGSDGALLRTVRTDTDGHLQVDVLSGGGTVGGALEATQLNVSAGVGAVADAAVTTDAVGSISGKMRGLVAIFAGVLATIGVAVKATALQIAGSDGTLARLIRTDTDGHVQVDVLSGGGTVGGSLEATQQEVLETQIERYIELQRCDVHTDFTAVLAADTIATTANHVPHEDKTASTSFNKIAGNVIGGIQDTITAVDASAFEGQTLMCWQVWLSSYADIDYLWLRVGTDASNYTEWRVTDVADFQASRFERIQAEQHQLFANTGNGADFSAITYVAAGVATSLAADTLSGIVIDYINMLSFPNVSANFDANVTLGNVSNAVRVTKFGANTNATAAVGSGAVSTGVQRVEIANDSTGQIYTRPKYTSTQILTNASADNAVPTGAVGTNLAADTISGHIEVTANADVTNADIVLYIRKKGSGLWQILPGGSKVDLQAETGDRWGVDLVGLIGVSAVYVLIDNYTDATGAGAINAYLTESTK